MRCSSSACNGWFLLFFIEGQSCIKLTCDNFCTVVIYYLEPRKIINLLFDTFHNTKYFHAHFYVLACYFCVGCFTSSNLLRFLWCVDWSNTMLL
jgi:hypothetical protein